MSHLIGTGPITGEVTCSDGTVYDVSSYWVEVADEHAAEVAHLVSTHYVTHGHPFVEGDFIYNEKDN